MKYKKIIFDLDNTILDFSDTEEKSLEKIITAYDLPFTKETIQTYKDINRGLWEKLEKGIITREQLFTSRFALFLDKYGIQVDGSKVDALFSKNLGSGFKMMDHAHELMTVLKRNGYTLYAGSNGVAEIQRQRMHGAGIEHFFEEIFISEEIGVEKPDPLFFNHIFDTVKDYNKDAFLMVGDSLTSDIKGANNAGIDSVWYNHTHAPVSTEHERSTYTISNLLEIIHLFDLSNGPHLRSLNHGK